MVTGSIQIKKGNYYAVISLKDENGNRKLKWVSTGLPVKGNNKKAAEAFLREELKKWGANKGVLSNVLAADYFEKWLEKRKDEVRQTTYIGYRGCMKNHIIPYFRNMNIKLIDITPLVLETYYGSLLLSDSNLETGEALSPVTIKHHHQILSKALADAAHVGMIPSNPAATAKTPRSKKHKSKFLNGEQLEEMLKLFKGSPVELPVKLCSVYGFRRSEVLGLKWDNVDLVNRTITISETLQEGIGGNYTDAPKTESSFRTLPMSEATRNLLTAQKRLQEDRLKLMGAYYVESDYVCTMPNGNVIKPGYLTHVFHSVISKSTLPNIRFHDLRHSVASNLLNSGFTVVQVQEWLGHSAASTTLNVYSHIDKTSKNCIAEAIDNIVNIA